MANHVVSFFIRAKDGATTVFRAITSGAKAMIAGLIRNGANIQAWGQMIAGVAHKVGAAFGHLWDAIRESMKFETLTGQFRVLLGSMDAARERMASLAKFAEVTPFQLDEIARASRTLTVMSQDALGTEWALKLVGDAAAATGGSIEELSMWVGRAYAMIAAGKPFGEAAMRLTELGALTPTVRDEMERLQAEGASAAEVWGVLTDHLEGFGGAMEQLSQTGDGLVSTLQDNWTAAVRTFGDAFLEETKDGIVFMINKLKELKDSGAIERWANAAVAALKPVKDLMVAVFGSEGSRGEALAAAWDYLKSVFRYGGDIIKAAANYFSKLLDIKILDLQNALYPSDDYEATKRFMQSSASAVWESEIRVAGINLRKATETMKASMEAAAAKAKREVVDAPLSTPQDETAKAEEDGKEKARKALEAEARRLDEKKRAEEEVKRAEEEAEKQRKEAAKAEEEAAKEAKKAAKAEAKTAKEAAEKAKERLEELEKRAKDSDYEREQRKKEEKEAKKKEREDKRLRRKAGQLLKQFATLRDPNALLREDFDVTRLGHSQRAVRDWMLASLQNRDAQQNAAKAEQKVDETNTLLKEIRDQNKELLSLS